MSTGLIDVIKRAAVEANENAQLCDLRYGTVVSTSPLKVQVTNVFTIPSSLLTVPEHLTKRTVSVKITLDPNENPVDKSGIGERLLTIDNSLKVGDKVALLRKSGGQSYFILDRI